jgi:hypothetical protein
VPSVALSFAITVWQVDAVPFQVPRLNPTVTVASGARLTMVARTPPPRVTLNGCVSAPFSVSVPVNVSVMGLPGSGDGVEGLMSYEHAAWASTSPRRSAGKNFVNMVSAEFTT